MLKLLIISIFILTSLASIAAAEEQMISTKERIRLSLWIDGIDLKVDSVIKNESKNRLPIELESALRKL